QALRFRALGVAERELGDRVADAPLDALRAEGDLLFAVAFAPLLGAVGVADGHSHDRDGIEGPADRHDSGDAAPGADDHVAADLLPQDAIRAADVVLALGRNGGGLQAEAVLSDGCRGLADDLVV